MYVVGKTQRMPYLYRSFSAKEPYILWLFCGKKLQTDVCGGQDAEDALSS